MGTPNYVYFTPDSLNAATAEVLADRHGVDLEVAEPRDLPRLERERADLIIDWDFVPEDYRTKLLNGSVVNVVAVHGYNVPDSVASFLPRRGIIFSRRLDDHFFQALAGLDQAA